MKFGMSRSNSASSFSAQLPVLKNYTLGEKLGRGTYATVYKGFKKDGLHSVVAVKCVKKSSLNSVSKENLLTEIELLKELNHENIVQLIEFQWDANFIFLIMEYCPGRTLLNFLRTHRTLSESLTRRILQQIAFALEYMRSRHVSHLDLKPQNILLSSSTHLQLKIADFGFAHYLVGETNVASLRGTPFYMAPEMMARLAYDERADLWSVGIISYQLLFGRLPFPAKSLEEVRLVIERQEIEVPPPGVVISEHCGDLLRHLLQRDPSRRHTFEEFLTHPFLEMEKAPTAHSLDKAMNIVTAAVEADQHGDAEEAVRCYCHALEHFVAAIHYERVTSRRKVLRQKVAGYMARAEQLKVVLRSTKCHRAKADGWTRREAICKLEKLYSSNADMKIALKTLKNAEQQEVEEQYEAALSLFESGIELALKVLSSESNSQRKQQLRHQIDVWLCDAEAVKRFVMLQKLRLQENTESQEQEEQMILEHSGGAKKR